MHSRAPFIFIVITVVLDAMGIGLIMPVMPDLIREIRGTSIADAAFWGGLLGFSYAAMQFLCGPLLGNLSDRFGRRPILIVSLLFMGLDYLLMAVAPTLFLLFVARIISGITGATYSTASAYLADISEPGRRSSNFGLISAAFGIGFVLGPAIGGLLGEYGVRVPFIAAGIFALANALFGYLILPETLKAGSRRKFEAQRANPFRALLRMKNMPMIGSLMLVVLLYSIANNVYAAIWSYFTIESFAWSLSTVGLSLAGYGLSAALIQIFLLRRLITRFGEDTTATLGLGISIFVYIAIIFIDSGRTLLFFMPIVALGAIVGPSLQGMMADRVRDDEQGELQGVFSSVIAIASIISPLLMTNIFKQFTQTGAPIYLPAAPFAAAAVLATIALIALHYTKHERRSLA